MLLRDKRVWLGVVVAVVLAFVSYYVVSNLGTDPNKKVAEQSLDTPSPAGSNSPLPSDQANVPAGSVRMPVVIGQRLNQARVNLTGLGLTNIKLVDVTGQNRPVIDEQNWVVDVQEPSPDVVIDTHTQVTLKVRKPTDEHSPQKTGFGVVPDVVCANLQDAQDALRESGFLILTSTDGSGQGRLVVIDRNWVVTAQSAPAGSKPGVTTHITLTVVKYGEPTNNPACSS